MLLRRLALIGCGLACSVYTACSASHFLVNEHVTYNFSDEGFLSDRMLQTIGTAVVDISVPGLENASRRCLDDALVRARERALRVMLHTRFGVPGNTGAAGGLSDFERDFPLEFSERDMIRGWIDFREILDRGFVVLKDNRSRESCLLVYRVQGEDLPAEFRAVPMSFQPETPGAGRSSPDDSVDSPFF
ncbi:MAG: hypothetical protein H7A21_11470 [Spirochaetales bacterium]|nr:hypothetical protein [Leptospiraceae bacterium]MCP5482046.1 hypothetical protein [Spirochaetales bacterium]MCP5484998.1 hypothetical protein [Spirochaetales bacterium]